ncbi:hypothetical protein ACF0H5_020659 [Mactra antiquata]
MLPFVARNRRLMLDTDEPIFNTSASEMISRIPKSTFHCRRIPLKAKCFCLLLIIFAAYLYGTIYLSWGANRLTNEEFLEVRKCPACYGHSFCFKLLDSQYDLTMMSQYKLFDTVNLKNVHYANHKHEGHSVVLKKLAHNDEIKKIDDKICQDSDREPGCDLSKRYVVTETSKDIMRNGLLPRHLKDTTFMFFCVTHKLIDRVSAKYKDRHKQYEPLTHDDQLQLLYTAQVNPEPLILQTFPASEGWPFPEYYGSCGRYIVVENSGKTLDKYFYAPFHVRASLSYQMLKMAEKFSSSEDWNLYWTDLSPYNFAVDPAGKLTYIDAENIIVVDKQATKLGNKETWNDLYESDYVECRDGHTDCLSFDVEALCTHHDADHNYYATCKNMLSQYADDRVNGGLPHLLHSMPSHAKDDWDLDNLLNECTRPHNAQGRIKAAHKLIQALDELRNIPDDKISKKGRRIQ